jgi:hypothetical protein
MLVGFVFVYYCRLIKISKDQAIILTTINVHAPGSTQSPMAISKWEKWPGV